MFPLTFLYRSLAIFVIIHSSTKKTTVAAIETSASNNGNPDATSARILINGQEYEFATPRQLTDAMDQEGDLELQSIPTDKKDTLAPYAAGTVKLPNAMNIYSAQLLDGPPGFGFVLWAEDPFFIVSQSLNWDRRILDMSPVREMSESWFNQDEGRQDPAIRDVTRIIWYIRDDPANTFVAIAQYEADSSNEESGTGYEAGLTADDASLFETRILSYQPTSRIGFDRLTRGQKRAARWKLSGTGTGTTSSSSSGAGRKVRTLTVPEMPPAVTGDSGGDSATPTCYIFGREAGSSRENFAYGLREGDWMFSLNRTPTELVCYPSTVAGIPILFT